MPDKMYTTQQINSKFFFASPDASWLEIVNVVIMLFIIYILPIAIIIAVIVMIIKKLNPRK
jgi:hypothetical protein